MLYPLLIRFITIIVIPYFFIVNLFFLFSVYFIIFTVRFIVLVLQIGTFFCALFVGAHLKLFFYFFVGDPVQGTGRAI